MLDTKKLTALAKRIKLLVLDIDGVMTDGKLYFSASGDCMKAFNTQDGLGLKMLMQSGIQVAIISGRVSEIVTQRAADLGITAVYQGHTKKLIALQDCSKKLNISLLHTAYMGDDIIDIPALREVALKISPLNSIPEVKKIVHYVTKRSGGDGAVREVCDLILKAQQLLKSAQQFYGV
jgi:3-deoxy-D-manno-octulosonate 8-phosphate phosphatase (KDO 8-P phosphatase)